MPSRSAGILVHRLRGGQVEVLLVHPGGPYWAKRDEGAWSIPKGEYTGEEDPLAAARREFAEELGTGVPDGPLEELGEVRLRSGKLIRAWSVAGELEADAARSNTFELEWPPRSGRHIQVPEIDRAEWFGLDQARRKLNPAQVELVARLAQRLGVGFAGFEGLEARG